MLNGRKICRLHKISTETGINSRLGGLWGEDSDTMRSLTRKFLLGVGAMTVAVTTLASAGAFLVFQHELEQRQIGYLKDYVAERTTTEDRRFTDLAGVHRAAAAAIQDRMTRLSPAQASRLFDLYFPLQPDGTRRSRSDAFDGRMEPTGDFVHGLGAFLADGRHVSPAEKALWVAAYSVTPHAGELLRGDYDNFYFFTPNNRMVMFAPDRPDKLMFYRRNAPPTLNFSREQMVGITLPANNPTRRTRCTTLQRLLQTNQGDRLATACVTPVDLNGRQVGAFGSSMVLTGYFFKAISRAMPGASNLIVTADGNLIAYPGFNTPGVASEASIARYERGLRLKSLTDSIHRNGGQNGVVLSPDGSKIVAYGLLSGPDWYFLIAYPRSAVMWSAAASASWILVLGLLASLAEAALVTLMARRMVTTPLSRLVEAAEAGPGADAMAPTQDIDRRDDEIGLLARTLRASRERADEVLSSLEQRVRERTAELEAANQEKSRFLANMSHELRTPLNGVVAVSETLAREQKTKRTREMADLIVSSGRLLERVLSDILDFSKIEAGQMALEPQDFDLQTLATHIAELHRASADAKGLGFAWSVDSKATGAYRGDPVRITQILSNLLSNAIKFTEAGQVSLAVDAVDEGLRFQIRDSGIGFDDQTRARLFRRFEQADASITRRFGGTGLGLAICRSLVDLMGGRIDVESAPGEGSTFSLLLPMQRLAGGVLATAEQDGDAGGGIEGARILLAEDHPTNQRVVQLILESLGVELVIACNGREALERLAESPFDLVLMDMQMPEMDGLTATAELRRLEAQAGAPRIPVIMLTANALDEHVKASFDAGVDAHLSKPIRPDALIGAISVALAGVSAQAVAEVA